MTAPKLTPRKAPRQPRARATVDAILIAGEQLARKLGLEALTTNHVAERAGVSIGSLYQYFPSKESLITALYGHRRSLHLAAIAAALAELGDATVGADAGELAVARAWVGGDDVDWPFDLGLRDYLVGVGATRKLVPIDEQAQRLLRQVLVRRGLTETAAARRGFAMLRAIEGAIAAVAREHPGWLRDGTLVGEIAVLVGALRVPASP